MRSLLRSVLAVDAVARPSDFQHAGLLNPCEVEPFSCVVGFLLSNFLTFQRRPGACLQSIAGA